MTHDTDGDWLRGNENQLDNSPLAPVKPPAEEVDRLADELATEYQNEKYRGWYCKVIYAHGIERVRYWQEKSRSGDFPGKLFAYYVRQADVGKAPEPAAVQDKVYEPSDEDLTDGGIKRQLDKVSEIFGLEDTGAKPDDKSQTGEMI